MGELLALPRKFLRKGKGEKGFDDAQIHHEAFIFFRGAYRTDGLYWDMSDLNSGSWAGLRLVYTSSSHPLTGQ